MPGLGNLSVISGNAESDFVNKQILAPKPVVSFETTEIADDDFVSYISKNKKADFASAKNELSKYCASLREKINRTSETNLHGIGKFFIDSSGALNFQPVEMPGLLFQPVAAERVIHPEAEHNILVGDKETTNTQMTEYFAEEPVVKDRWWIWAIVLGLIGIGVIMLYLNDNNGNSSFGIATNISNL